MEKISIERLLNWAFVDQQVGRLQGRDDLALLAVRSSMPCLAEIAALGCRVDKTGAAGLVADRCPDDAVAVYNAVKALEHWRLVLVVALTGEWPDWLPAGVGHFEPVRNGKGKIKHEFRDPVRCRGPIWCHVRFEGNWPDQVAAGRRDYERVWCSLDYMSRRFVTGLDRFSTLPLDRPRRPWERSGHVPLAGGCQKSVDLE